MIVRRSIDELILRLRLEPTVYDVIVEGPSDRALLEWYLRRSGCSRNIRVYPIDEIQVDGGSPDGGHVPGNRERILSLGRSVIERADPGSPLILVVDRDLDVLLDLTPSNPYLLMTDHAGLEGLYFDESVLERFLSLYVRRRVVEPAVLLSALQGPLTEVFLVRCADKVLNLNLGALSPGRCCSVGDAALLYFDREDYITRYLMRGASDRRAELEKTIAVLRRTLDERTTNPPPIHGRDFVGLLCHVLRPYVANSSTLLREDVVHRALMLCLDDRMLRVTPFFSQLLSKLGCR